MVGQTTAVVRVDLRALAKQINAAHTAFVDGLRQTLAYAADAGEMLLQVKEHLPHGGFQEWIDKHFDGSYRTAAVYMTVAKRRVELEANVQHAALLSLRGALRVLADGSDESDGDPLPWTPQDIITHTTASVVKLCERTPPDYRDLLAKRLRDLAAEIEQRGGVS